jgi:hypothetical protein
VIIRVGQEEIQILEIITKIDPDLRPEPVCQEEEANFMAKLSWNDDV